MSGADCFLVFTTLDYTRMSVVTGTAVCVRAQLFVSMCVHMYTCVHMRLSMHTGVYVCR